MSLLRSLTFVFGLAVVAVIASAASSCGTTAGSSKGSDASEVRVYVKGRTPAGVDITYGNDGSTYQGPKTLGIWGPEYWWNEALPIEADSLYYQVTAQLQGGGNITCKLTIGDAVAIGHAQGGHNSCSARLKHLGDGWE